ncbi:MAG: zinc ribbon domain-containing protein, partial [Anaerolineaceae bacterium]|nr:zinc ribbon domain-containing protein [Anaerolineaceae bacterium]
MKSCPFCSEPIEDDALECSACGKKLDAAVVIEELIPDPIPPVVEVNTDLVRQPVEMNPRPEKNRALPWAIAGAVLFVSCLCLVVAGIVLLSVYRFNAAGESAVVNDAQAVELEIDEEVSEIITESAPAAKPTLRPQPTATITMKSLYEIGEPAVFHDHTVYLVGVEHLSTGVLKATFLILNQGSEPLTVSSWLDFEAALADGTMLEKEIFDCGPALDATLIVGDQLLGDICFSGAADLSGLRITYTPTLFSDPIAFNAAMEGNRMPPDLRREELSANFIAVGETAKLSDHTIVLNGIERNGNLLTADFTIENTSSELLSVSSLMSFDAKAAYGSKFSQDLFNCEGSMDGEVQPGQTLRGKVCWKVN